MTAQDIIQTLCAYGTPMDEEEFQEALNGAVEKLGAMVELSKQLEELINKPCTNQNMMAQNLAYRNVQKMIKKQLAEVSGKDCRDCKKWNDCECGKKGHDNGTSIGYSAGECSEYDVKGDKE